MLLILHLGVPSQKQMVLTLFLKFPFFFHSFLEKSILCKIGITINLPRINSLHGRPSLTIPFVTICCIRGGEAFFHCWETYGERRKGVFLRIFLEIRIKRIRGSATSNSLVYIVFGWSREIRGP